MRRPCSPSRAHSPSTSARRMLRLRSGISSAAMHRWSPGAVVRPVDAREGRVLGDGDEGLLIGARLDHAPEGGRLRRHRSATGDSRVRRRARRLPQPVLRAAPVDVVSGHGQHRPAGARVRGDGRVAASSSAAPLSTVAAGVLRSLTPRIVISARGARSSVLASGSCRWSCRRSPWPRGRTRAAPPLASCFLPSMNLIRCLQFPRCPAMRGARAAWRRREAERATVRRSSRRTLALVACRPSPRRLVRSARPAWTRALSAGLRTYEHCDRHRSPSYRSSLPRRRAPSAP